jgi:hypothetical protein
MVPFTNPLCEISVIKISIAYSGNPYKILHMNKLKWSVPGKLAMIHF